MRAKDSHGMANSIDPDQAVPLGAESDLGLHCLPRPVCPKTYSNITVLRDFLITLQDWHQRRIFHCLVVTFLKRDES